MTCLENVNEVKEIGILNGAFQWLMHCKEKEKKKKRRAGEKAERDLLPNIQDIKEKAKSR